MTGVGTSGAAGHDVVAGVQVLVVSVQNHRSEQAGRCSLSALCVCVCVCVCWALRCSCYRTESQTSDCWSRSLLVIRQYVSAAYLCAVLSSLFISREGVSRGRLFFLFGGFLRQTAACVAGWLRQKDRTDVQSKEEQTGEKKGSAERVRKQRGQQGPGNSTQ